MSAKPLVILQHDANDPPAGIAAALTALGVRFEVRRLHDGDPLPAWPGEAAGLISLGGPMHVHQTHQFPFLEAEVKLLRHVIHDGGAVWGVCLGAQLVCQAAGGDVFKLKAPEVGWVSVEKETDDALLHNISSPFLAFSWHEYACKVPSTSHLVASTDVAAQVFRAGGNAWGTQFHPEIDAVIAPHWVEDAAKDLKHVDAAWLDKLRRDTEDNLSAGARLCRQLTENFTAHCCLLPGA